ncbi:DUF1295 domain-containing protein [Williamsia sterculiae]|uniref:Steroid 5-alpha reductase family enzyme n=1 Tax=Williamsia sterculiae TaxID=1344003 RepID=A0A1N7EYZ4_9NOCA|nr:DUF1295 domain-containing protein [Williamsia sterculiae]SIR93145.1 Steroid 5-alpha reductase family enzyme [Williamsia sterculiae]
MPLLPRKRTTDTSALDIPNLRRVVAASAAVTAVAQAVTAAFAVRDTRRDYADAVWGPGLAGIAVASAVVGDGDRTRRWTLATITSVWAGRLANLMIPRIAGSEKEDPRYTEYLEGASTPTVLAKVFGTQALAQLVVSAPIQIAAASALPAGRRRWLFPLGAAVMVAGTVIEATADRQKDAYKKRDDPDKPAVLDTGLWGWSRHPNYFGDSLMWDGVWVAAATSTPGLATFPAPAAMSYFLIYATGATRTEKRMQERPAYRDYQRRVAFFFPRPPSDG